MAPHFEIDGEQYTLSEMLTANADDTELCAWLQTARVGDRFPAIVSCVRVA